MEFADWMEGRTAAFLFTTLKFVALVVIGTIGLSLVSILAIEAAQDRARNIRQWLKKPGIWA